MAGFKWCFVSWKRSMREKVWNEILTIKNGKHYKDVIDENGKYPIYEVVEL